MSQAEQRQARLAASLQQVPTIRAALARLAKRDELLLLQRTAVRGVLSDARVDDNAILVAFGELAANRVLLSWWREAPGVIVLAKFVCERAGLFWLANSTLFDAVLAPPVAQSQRAGAPAASSSGGPDGVPRSAVLRTSRAKVRSTSSSTVPVDRAPYAQQPSLAARAIAFLKGVPAMARIGLRSQLALHRQWVAARGRRWGIVLVINTVLAVLFAVLLFRLPDAEPCSDTGIAEIRRQLGLTPLDGEGIEVFLSASDAKDKKDHVLMSIPIQKDMDHLVAEFKQLIKPLYNNKRKDKDDTLSTARYPIHSRPVVSSLHRRLMVYQTHKAHTESKMSLSEIGSLAGVTVRDKEQRAVVTRKHLTAAQNIIRNVVLRKFPVSD